MEHGRPWLSGNTCCKWGNVGRLSMWSGRCSVFKGRLIRYGEADEG